MASNASNQKAIDEIDALSREIDNLMADSKPTYSEVVTGASKMGKSSSPTPKESTVNVPKLGKSATKPAVTVPMSDKSKVKPTKAVTVPMSEKSKVKPTKAVTVPESDESSTKMQPARSASPKKQLQLSPVRRSQISQKVLKHEGASH